jgi:hypothetical protein
MVMAEKRMKMHTTAQPVHEYLPHPRYLQTVRTNNDDVCPRAFLAPPA